MPVHARVATDPIHPLLVEFPIVLYAATVATLIGHAVGGGVAWYRAALYASAASVVVAIVAVVPSIVDLAALAPLPRLRALGRRHALCGIVALIAFSAAFATIFHGYARTHQLGDAAPLVLASIGLVAAIVAAWLGWVIMLVARDAQPPSQAVGHELVQRLPTPRR